MLDAISLTLAATGGGGDVLVSALIILATAGLVAVGMRRLRLEVVPAYLIAGALIGPHALQLVASADSVNAISHTAMILLMFGIGLHLDLGMLRSGVGVMVLAGACSCVAITAVGWPIALAFGLPAPTALAVAMALSMSSTAVVLRILMERREIRRPAGRMAFFILIVQDIVAIAMLVAISGLAQWAGVNGEAAVSQERTWGEFIADAALKIGIVAGIIVVGRLLLPPLLREAAKGKSAEVMMVLSTAAALGAAIATQSVGFSAELGAFLAGLLLSATPFRHQLSGQIGPVRDLFIAVFFTAVGMQLNPSTLVSSWWIIALALVVMLVIKAGLIGLTCWSVGAAPTTSVAVGLSLAQAGEFSLVVLASASHQKVINDGQLSAVTAVVAISLIITPSLFRLSSRLRPWALRLRPAPWISSGQVANLMDETPNEEESAPESALRLRHVVLAGYGVVGRAVAEKLDTLGVPYTIVEFNPNTVKLQTGLGRSVVFGDVTNEAVLESAGVGYADAVILTIPDEEAVLRSCQLVRSMNPSAFIAARTNYLSKGMLATSLGADHVTVEELATAESMAWEVTKRLTERALGQANVLVPSSPGAVIVPPR